MFSTWRVSERLFALTGFFIICLVSLSLFELMDLRRNLLEDRKEKAHNVVQVAYSAVEFYADKAQKGEISLQEAKDLALNNLESLRYGESDYFWVNDSNAKVLMHPFAKKLVGTDGSNVKDTNGIAIFAEAGKIGANGGEGFIDYLWPRPGSEEPVEKTSYVKGYAPWGWVIGTGIYIDDVDAIFYKDLTFLGISASLILIAGIFVSIWISRSVTSPLANMVNMVGRLSKGDFSSSLDVNSTRSELGKMEEALMLWKSSAIIAKRREVALDECATSVVLMGPDNAITYVNQSGKKLLEECKNSISRQVASFDKDDVVGKHISNVLPAVANLLTEGERKLIEDRVEFEEITWNVHVSPVVNDFGEHLGTVIEIEDLTHKLREEMLKHEAEKQQLEAERVFMEKQKARAQKTAELLENHVAGAIENVVSSTVSMRQEAERMTEISRRSSDKSNVVTSASEDAAHSVEAVAAAASEISRSIYDIRSKVINAAETARNAVSDAKSANETVQGLSDASIKIGDVVGLIQDIAAQTNLLALNATIEAARAGEAGKGFAVVASEVKNLASQTAKATEDIANQVNAIQDATLGAVDAIGQVTEAVEKIDMISSDISSQVNQQADATNEITQNAQTAAHNTGQVTDNISEIASGSSQIGTAANDVLSASDNLSGIARQLNHTVSNYLKELEEEDRVSA
ncbi:HAMP domain-containing protein [Sneathiella sp. P13V-1]|uniref:cache domain-containing protein n=1 Tax=Sneathiella sp. P13V-1 TaxID=2697366 RepID=UPI00187B9EA4|nr:cache domain-containing protein [Sneathiella sp. P13V-1]MBE7635994.1 HAMP domain-containing protein [Sneathiella sp. P13V-1]